MRRIALLAFLAALSGCKCTQDERTAPKEGDTRSLVNGTSGQRVEKISPEEAKIAPPQDEVEVPPPELQACDLCDQGTPGPQCTACHAGERCVQSLLDATWAVLSDDGGDDVYLHQPAPDGSLVWRREFRRAGERRKVSALKKDHPDFPPDLERYVTTLGECPPSGETIAASVDAYFAPPEGSPRLEVVEAKTSTKSAKHARANVRTPANKLGTVYLERDDRCPGWRVVRFGFPGCPTFPPGWPADLE